MFACFQIFGTIPVSVRLVKMVVSIGSISFTHSLRILAGMQSGPDALLGLHFFRSFLFILLVQLHVYRPCPGKVLLLVLEWLHLALRRFRRRCTVCLVCLPCLLHCWRGALCLSRGRCQLRPFVDLTARFFSLPLPFFLIPCDLDLRFLISKRENTSKSGILEMLPSW